MVRLSNPPLFTIDELEDAYLWVCDIRKDYSPNSDIWELRRNWPNIKDSFLAHLNNGLYEFKILDRYEIEDAVISLWHSQDMIALKLITNALQLRIGPYIPKSCYHVKGHGGLKKAIQHTHAAIPDYQYVMRSDIKGYYDSINFNILLTIIETYVKHPILLKLIRKACHRTETTGGLFYDYHDKNMPKGSPLSPLCGAIALIPLDLAMQQMHGIFYARFMDDWVVFTKSKTALRKVIKLTHSILNALKFQLHPTKTYIGKISHGFNFLAYYMDDQKILPATETIRRFFERAAVLYEHSSMPRRYKKNVPDRDISEYQVNEAAPTNAYVHNQLTSLFSLASHKPDIFKRIRQYLSKWACWLKQGLTAILAFESCIQTYLPGIYSCWSPAALLSELVG